MELHTHNGCSLGVYSSRTLCIMQRAEQQQAVREHDTSARRAARAAQSAEQQQAVRELDASTRRAARVVQPAKQQ